MMRAALVSSMAVVALWPADDAVADHANLDEGLPVEVQDAYPLEYLGREVQARLQYRRTAAGEHEVRLEPRFELGLPYNGQLSIHVPLIASTAEGNSYDVGRTTVDYFYNLNQETLSVPALSLAVGVEAPDTRQGGSFDPFGRVVLTKTIPGLMRPHRLHLNGTIQANVAREEATERSYRYVAIAGYDVRVSPTVTAVLDGVRDRPLENRAAENFGEIGLRIDLTPLSVLSIGGGAGQTDDGDLLLRATIGFQSFAF
jgi:hypothetical protein